MSLKLNDVLTIPEIAYILKDHGIKSEIENNTIIGFEELYTADNKAITEKVNLTGFTVKKLRDWLGY